MKSQKWALIASLVVIAALALLVIYPFIPAILAGAILAYIEYPIYKWLKKFINKKSIAAMLVILISIFVILIPLTLALNMVSREAYSMYLFARESGSLAGLGEDCGTGIFCSAIGTFKNAMTDSNVAFYLGEALRKATVFLVEASSDFIFSIPAKAIDLFIALVVMYYFLVDGKRMVKGFWDTIPLKKTDEHRIQKKFSDVASAVVYGHLLTALVQGMIGALGFYFLSVKGWIIWGILIGLAGLIPVVGTALVWAPISMYFIAFGALNNDMTSLLQGAGILLYGVLIISMVDNLVRPKLISGKAKVHPAIILIGLLGGMKLLGLIGIVYGPLILALAVTIFSIYKEETK